MPAVKQTGSTSLTDQEIHDRLSAVVCFRVLDTDIESDIHHVGPSSVTVLTADPLEEDESAEHVITFDMIRNWDEDPHRSIRTSLARVLGLSVPKPSELG